MPCADGILSQNQRSIGGNPNRQRPIPNQFAEAPSPPLFVSCRYDFDVGCTGMQAVIAERYELVSVVQPAVPGDDRTAGTNVGLHFTARLFGGVKGLIVDGDIGFTVGTQGIRAKRS